MKCPVMIVAGPWGHALVPRHEARRDTGHEAKCVPPVTWLAACLFRKASLIRVRWDVLQVNLATLCLLVVGCSQVSLYALRHVGDQTITMSRRSNLLVWIYEKQALEPL